MTGGGFNGVSHTGRREPGWLYGACPIFAIRFDITTGARDRIALLGLSSGKHH